MVIIYCIYQNVFQSTSWPISVRDWQTWCLWWWPKSRQIPPAIITKERTKSSLSRCFPFALKRRSANLKQSVAHWQHLIDNNFFLTALVFTQIGPELCDKMPYQSFFIHLICRSTSTSRLTSTLWGETLFMKAGNRWYSLHISLFVFVCNIFFFS